MAAVQEGFVEEEELSEEELKRRVLYSLLAPAVGLARLFGVSLKELNDQVSMAYFESLRSRGLTLKEAADALGVSHRSASRLSKQQRQSFFRPELDHDLPRLVEFKLGNRPMSRQQLMEALAPRDEAEIEQTLEVLMAQERVRQIPSVPPIFEATSEIRRLSRNTWMNRIGGLNSLTETVAAATFGRFFATEPRAFARTLSFRALDVDVARLERLYSEILRPVIEDIDRKADEADEERSVQLSICWAPFKFLQEQDP